MDTTIAILRQTDFIAILVMIVAAKFLIFSPDTYVSNNDAALSITILMLFLLYNIIKKTYLLIFKYREKTSFLSIIFFLIILIASIDTISSINIFIYTIDSSAFKYPSDLNYLTNVDLYYYSVINLTGVGFGDITPISENAKIISAITSILGYLTFASALAILLNAYGNTTTEK